MADLYIGIHIDRTFALEELPLALAHVGENHALGKVVVPRPDAIGARSSRDLELLAGRVLAARALGPSRVVRLRSRVWPQPDASPRAVTLRVSHAAPLCAGIVLTVRLTKPGAIGLVKTFQAPREPAALDQGLLIGSGLEAARPLFGGGSSSDVRV